MKKIIGILMMSFIILLVGCAGNVENEDYREGDSGIVENPIEVGWSRPGVQVDEEVLGEISELTHLFADGNRVIRVDLASGEVVDSFEFGEHQTVGAIRSIDDGFYQATVSYIDGMMFNRNYVIFDDNFNYIETFERNMMGASRFVDGVLYTYALTGPVDPPWQFIRNNGRTGEREILFETSVALNAHEFIDDNHILVNSWIDSGSASFQTIFEILDFSSGNTQPIETISNFSILHVVSNGSQIIITENEMHESVTREYGISSTNQVVIFDIETMTHQVVQLEVGDSHLARLTEDGNHIVSVNVAESVFRKYDLSGGIIAETSIELPEYFSFLRSDLIQVAENVYFIRINTVSDDGINDFHNLLVQL